jgi:hypothetical protein
MAWSVTSKVVRMIIDKIDHLNADVFTEWINDGEKTDLGWPRYDVHVMALHYHGDILLSGPTGY